MAGGRAGRQYACMRGDAVAVGRKSQPNRSKSKAVYHRPQSRRLGLLHMCCAAVLGTTGSAGVMCVLHVMCHTLILIRHYVSTVQYVRGRQQVVSVCRQHLWRRRMDGQSSTAHSQCP